ncbi:hypothetical protein [Leptospira kmetyi]|uniref:hypothetical protein n=1 Tax=Leptospira kmetyi TaxID=408139 RepID=UPI000F63EB5E|nr:hypothetical protein [Leptospira kmetyi]
MRIFIVYIRKVIGSKILISILFFMNLFCGNSSALKYSHKIENGKLLFRISGGYREELEKLLVYEVDNRSQENICWELNFLGLGARPEFREITYGQSRFDLIEGEVVVPFASLQKGKKYKLVIARSGIDVPEIDNYEFEIYGGDVMGKRKSCDEKVKNLFLDHKKTK